MPISVALVEDDAGYRNTLFARLQANPEFTCLRAWPSAEEALRELPVALPDVLLVDLELGRGKSGVDLICEVNLRFLRLRSLVLTKYHDPEHVFEAIRAGAHGYVLKREGIEQVSEAIRDVHSGGRPMTPPIARMALEALRELLPDTKGAEKLTERECQILELAAEGRFYRQIADVLGCEYHTVRSHFNHIYEKLHVHSRAEALQKFHQSKRIWPWKGRTEA